MAPHFHSTSLLMLPVVEIVSLGMEKKEG